MNIFDYKYYVRDIGFENDNQLERVVTDVIKDIAKQTSIFKYTFGFTITDDNVYDFKELERVDENNKTPSNKYYIGDKNQLVREDKGIYNNTYLSTIDIIYDQQIMDDYNKIDSKFSLFEHLNDGKYIFVGSKTLYKGKDFICINSIIPHIKNITADQETIIKTTVIEGIKYYADTTLNNQNVNPDVNSYKKYDNALKKLQNKFPIYYYKQTDKRINRWI